MKKSFTRFCLKVNTKLFDLKKCFLCELYKKKEHFNSNLNFQVNNPTILGHLKFNSCEYSSNLDVTQLAEKDTSPRTIKKTTNITKKFLKNIEIQPKEKLKIIEKNWKKLSGKIFYEKISPQKIIKNKLYVSADESAVLQDFHFVKFEIIKNINNLFQKNVINEIKIK